jgi:hypothetical protein
MPSKPLLTLAGLISLLALVAVPAAFADQLFHTSHAAVYPVTGAPLQSGFRERHPQQRRRELGT